MLSHWLLEGSVTSMAREKFSIGAYHNCRLTLFARSGSAGRPLTAVAPPVFPTDNVRLSSNIGSASVIHLTVSLLGTAHPLYPTVT